jgi:hypothetical protein
MRYEVFYTYAVDASIRVEAASEQEAMDKVEKMWSEAGDTVHTPKTLEYTDFEVLYAKKR